MRRLHILLVSCVLALGCVGCVSWKAPVRPPSGALVTTYKAPMTTSFKETPTDGRVGRASTYYFHDILITGLSFSFREAGVEQAADAGNLDQVYYADYRMLQVLGVFGKFTTEAHGK